MMSVAGNRFVPCMVTGGWEHDYLFKTTDVKLTNIMNKFLSDMQTPQSCEIIITVVLIAANSY